MTAIQATAESILTQVSYDPETGEFTRITPGRWFGTKAGSPIKAGYILITLGKERVYAHRLAWFLAHGEWPSGVIDHTDGNPANNRISNLRKADRSQNGYNRQHDPMRGIRWYAPLSKWHARIMKDGKERHIGYFRTIGEAQSAYRKKAAELYGEFACRI